MDKAREDFIRARTKLSAPPLVPEILLHLASDSIALWQETETFAPAGGQINLPPPYWAFAWPGGQALARYLLDKPQAVAGHSVLDFGTGTGLVAIAAAKAGAAPVCAADIDTLALVALEMNAQANRVFIEPLAHDLIGEKTRWRTVLCGDMCYERPLAQRLIVWMRTLAADGVQVIVGDPGRTYFPGDSEHLRLTRLATYSVPTSRDLEDRDWRDASVYRVTV